MLRIITKTSFKSKCHFKHIKVYLRKPVLKGKSSSFQSKKGNNSIPGFAHDLQKRRVRHGKGYLEARGLEVALPWPDYEGCWHIFANGSKALRRELVYHGIRGWNNLRTDGYSSNPHKLDLFVKLKQREKRVQIWMLKHRKANNKINQNNRTRATEVDACAYVLSQCWSQGYLYYWRLVQLV